MRDAGDYSTRFTHRRRTRPSKDAVGQPVEQFNVIGQLWGRFEADKATAETTDRQRQQERNAIITLRNNPSVAPGDTLESVLGTWTVRTARYDRAADELVCDVKQ